MLVCGSGSPFSGYLFPFEEKIVVQCSFFRCQSFFCLFCTSMSQPRLDILTILRGGLKSTYIHFIR